MCNGYCHFLVHSFHNRNFPIPSVAHRTGDLLISCIYVLSVYPTLTFSFLLSTLYVVSHMVSTEFFPNLGKFESAVYQFCNNHKPAGRVMAGAGGKNNCLLTAGYGFFICFNQASVNFIFQPGSVLFIIQKRRCVYVGCSCGFISRNNRVFLCPIRCDNTNNRMRFTKGLLLS